MNDDVRAVVPWDAEFEELYSDHGILGEQHAK
jgi:hypothetical protein